MGEVDNTRFEKVPTRAVISGVGLKDMPVPRFNTFVRTLNSMGIEIEAVGAEALIEDLPVRFQSFADCADEQSKPHLATRAWNALHRATSIGRREGDSDDVFPWNLAIDRQSLSYLALRDAVNKDLIETVPNIGEACEGLVRDVVDSIEVPAPVTSAE
ncbi:MAG TPA: hypothetical protein VFW77_04705 [Candidatus Saccharimonadales bacterium]|nr:hypothetical protein [Candidatus Saccharimonadales bacterium]